MKKHYIPFILALAVLSVNCGCNDCTSSEAVSCDISKVAKLKMDGEMDFNRARASLIILNSRMVEFKELVKVSCKAAEGKPELESAVAQLQSTYKLSVNARKSGEKALKAFEDLSIGNKADYGQASRDFRVAYLMAGRLADAGKKYVNDVDEYLQKYPVSDNVELAYARDRWTAYCAGQAVLTDDKEGMAYWQNKSALLDDSAMAELEKADSESDVIAED